jgi:hypothetical protein
MHKLYYFGLLLVAVSAIAAPLEAIDESSELEAFSSMDRGVTFLLREQAEDGSWSGSVAVTARCLMALVAAAEQRPEKTIERAVLYLERHTRLGGPVGTTDDTALAARALAITGSETKYNPVVVDVRNLRSIYAYLDAGFFGQPHWLDGEQLITLEMLEAFQINNLDEKGHGGFAAEVDGVVTSELTSLGIQSRIYAGADRTDVGIALALAWLKNNPGFSENPGAGQACKFSCLYAYATARMMSERLYNDLRNQDKDSWRKSLIHALLECQGAGAWRNKDGSCGEEDANLATALSLLAMAAALN